ncbi:hypothetical protein [Alloscardovia theropitheci]|nr:hypothetical protein [Alloscardovia theropitheci]
MVVWNVFAIAMGCVYTYFYIYRDKHIKWLEKLQEYDTSALLNFGLVFFVVAVSPIVISLMSAGIQHVFAVMLTVVIIGILPAMIVDAIYGAIWVRKHPYKFDDD